MKKIFTSLFLLGISFPTFAQIPTAGQVAYFPFNGNANDQSGNNHNGTVFGATLTNDRFGNSNSAYSFNGTSDYIDIGNSNSLTLNNFTMSVWVNEQGDHNGGIGGGVVAGKSTGDAGEVGYRINIENADNKGYFVVSRLGATSPSTGYVNTVNTFINTQWSHIVAVRSNDSLMIYKNGNLENITTGITASINTDNNFMIGKADASGNYFFFGYIDDLRIYNRSLDATEINNLYNENTSSSNCLIAQYNFTGNANDISGYGLNGTVFGATLAPDRYLNPNSAYHFDGINDYIEVADNSLLGFSNNQVSISYWAKIESYNSNSTFNKLVISKQSGSGSSQSGLNVWYNSGNGGLLLKDGISGNFGGASIGSTSNLNQWYHVVYTWDGTTGNSYVDGVLINSSTTSNVAIGANNLSLLIGKANWSNINAEPFHGWIDDINIYSCAISQQEIDSLYNAGSVGIEIVETNILKIFPNPTTNVLNIVNGQGNYVITDVFGRIVKELNITTDNFQLNTTNFKSGIYFLISTANNSSIKFIKQ